MRPEIAAFATPAKHRVKLAQLSAGPEPWKILSLTETKDKRRPAMRDPIGVPRTSLGKGRQRPTNEVQQDHRGRFGLAFDAASGQESDRNNDAAPRGEAGKPPVRHVNGVAPLRQIENNGEATIGTCRN